MEETGGRGVLRAVEGSLRALLAAWWPPLPASSVLALRFPTLFALSLRDRGKIKWVYKEFEKRNQPICPPPTLRRMAAFQGYGVVHGEIQYQTVVHDGTAQR